MGKINLTKIITLALLAIVMVFRATPSQAALSELWNYLGQFQVGIDYSNSIDHVNLSYDVSTAGGVPEGCDVVADDATKKRCRVGMVSGSSSGWGVFLERAFKKQGRFYFDWDISIGSRYLTGELPAKYRDQNNLPLRKASFSLVAFVLKPYIQFGVTPEGWPDVLVSMGPALQLALGNVNINDEVANVAIGTSSYKGPLSLLSGFFAIEFVLYRFGEGAFSLIANHDLTGNGEGSSFFPRDVDGMSNFRGVFSRRTGGSIYGYGLKLLLPIP